MVSEETKEFNAEIAKNAEERSLSISGLLGDIPVPAMKMFFVYIPHDL